ncbi:PP0621 family protein [Candidatus Vondammii sp. HM_W22]|uniref:PP0621 family protein n=1 Tax=Candidatus Vondammii sp. HM_W22 TaxID=2687299 RepID=UPI00403D7D63
MGFRFLLAALTIWAIYFLVRRAYLRKRASSKTKNFKPAVDMVQCKYCGTHIPLPEAIVENGVYYCCRKHLEADK